jgi:hypothetical protein
VTTGHGEEMADVPGTTPELWRVMAELGGDISRLEQAVAALNQGSIIRLAWAFESACQSLVRLPYQGEDRDFHEAMAVAAWTVTRGEKHFTEVLEDPSKMPSTLPKDRIVSFLGVLAFYLEDRFGGILPPMPRAWGRTTR